ncbi:MAG: FeoA family protein [bacterium]|jgi:ferrous iron transport protein A
MITDNKETLIPLSMLPSGQSAQIISLEMTGGIKRRLLDLGLVPGTQTAVAFSSPMGDPSAYRVRGTTLALRAKEAQLIMVRRLEL